MQIAVSNHPNIHGSHARVARLHAEEGFGFLETADGREVLFQRACVAHDAFDQLLIGDEVVYEEELGQKGAQATMVQRVREPGRLGQT